MLQVWKPEKGNPNHKTYCLHVPLLVLQHNVLHNIEVCNSVASYFGASSTVRGNGLSRNYRPGKKNCQQNLT